MGSVSAISSCIKAHYLRRIYDRATSAPYLGADGKRAAL